MYYNKNIAIYCNIWYSVVMPEHSHDFRLMAYIDHCADLKEMLSLLEWGLYEVPRRCPFCCGEKPDHHDDCELDALLAVNIEGVLEVRGNYGNNFKV